MIHNTELNTFESIFLNYFKLVFKKLFSFIKSVNFIVKQLSLACTFKVMRDFKLYYLKKIHKLKKMISHV